MSDLTDAEFDDPTTLQYPHLHSTPSTITVHGRRYELRPLEVERTSASRSDTVLVVNSRGRATAQVWQSWSWSMPTGHPLMSRTALLIGAPDAWTIPDRQAVILAAIRLLEETIP